MMISGLKLKIEVFIDPVLPIASSPYRYKYINEATKKFNQDGMWGWVICLQSLQTIESQLLDREKHYKTIQDQGKYL